MPPRPSTSDLRPPTPPTARHLLWLAMAYGLLVAYASLAPFQFRPLPLAEAGTEFGRLLHADAGRLSRSDLAVNFLLLMPLSFLALGALAVDRRPVWGALAAIAVVPACTLFAAGLEFAQLYFPPRVTSLQDMVMQSIGALTAAVLWLLCGPPLIRTSRRFWSGYRERGIIGSQLLLAYLGLLLLLHAIPFDLMTSPAELYHKWRAGRIVFVPWGGAYDSCLAAVEANALNIACFLPAGVLLAVAPSRVPAGWRRGVRVAASGLGIAAAVEVLQLWVSSRRFDVTDILTGAAAVLVGWLVVRGPATLPPPPVRQRTVTVPPCERGKLLRPTLVSLGLVAWLAVLATCFWWPLDFALDARAIVQRRQAIVWMPFADYYRQNYVRALEQLVDKTLRAVPLGVLLAAAFPFRRSCLRIGFALAAVSGVALVLEAGQLLVPGRYPAVTDVLIVLLGGGMGCWLFVAATSAAERVGERLVVQRAGVAAPVPAQSLASPRNT